MYECLPGSIDTLVHELLFGLAESSRDTLSKERSNAGQSGSAPRATAICRPCITETLQAHGKTL